MREDPNTIHVGKSVEPISPTDQGSDCFEEKFLRNEPTRSKIDGLASMDSDSWCIFEKNFLRLCLCLGTFFIIPGIKRLMSSIGYPESSIIDWIPGSAIIVSSALFINSMGALSECSKGKQKLHVRRNGGLLISSTVLFFLFVQCLLTFTTGRKISDIATFQIGFELLLIPSVFVLALRANKFFSGQPGYFCAGAIFCLPYFFIGLPLLLAPGFAFPFIRHFLFVPAYFCAIAWQLIGCSISLRIKSKIAQITLFVVFGMPLLMVPLLGPLIVTMVCQCPGPALEVTDSEK